MKQRRLLPIQRGVPYALVLVLLMVAGQTGCNISSSPAAPMTNPAGEVAVEPGQKIAIQADAAGATRYEWELQGEGEISQSTGQAILYIAPEAEGGMAILSVTASNDRGASPSTALTIQIATVGSVRLDVLAVPAGYMSGGGAAEDFIGLAASPNDCHTGSDCLQITYIVGGQWGGIYWWPLSCGQSGSEAAWNSVRADTCGVNVPEIGDLDTVNRLTFWVRGHDGGEVVEFRIGGVDISPEPGRSLGKVTLNSTWEQYEINLENVDLTNAVGLFMWTAADVDNPRDIVFYLDDIQFEGMQ